MAKKCTKKSAALANFFLRNKPYCLLWHSVAITFVIAKGAECYCFHFQPTFHTIEDIYEVQLDTDRGVKEKIRIFDTAGLVSELIIITFQPAAKINVQISREILIWTNN